MENINESNSQLPLSAKVELHNGPLFPLRYWMVVLCFTGFTFVFILRVNIGVAIVAMINTTAQAHPPDSPAKQATLLHTHKQHQCPSKPSSNVTAATPLPANGEFNWSEQAKAQILSTFSYGYLITSLFGGYLSQRFGSYKVFGISVLLTSLPTLLSAPAARLSEWALLAVRLVEGLADGVAFPAIHCFWSHWAPIHERTRLIGITYAGTSFGAIIGNYLAGWLTQAYGWPTVFYVSGIAATLWCIVWFVFSASSPRESRWISAYERDFIETSLTCHNAGDRRALPFVPWKQFATSLPVYAIFVSQFASAWILATFGTYTPSYLANVLKFSTAKTGLLNALPYMLQCVMMIVLNFTGDFLMKCGPKPIGPRRTTIVRRLMNGIGMFGPGIFVALVPTAGCNATAAMVMLTLSLATLSGCSAGFLVNHVDIAAEYAGHLMAVGSTFSTVGSLSVPTVAASLAGPGNAQTVASWSSFFYLLSGLQIFGGIFYSIWGSGERLSWLDEYLRKESSNQA